MNIHVDSQRTCLSVPELFAQALDGSGRASGALLEQASYDPAAGEALLVLVVSECDRLEREDRLDALPVSSLDQILAAVRDAFGHREGYARSGRA